MESYAPKDGEDSDDPDIGGGEDGELLDEYEDCDDSDDGKYCMQKQAIKLWPATSSL